MSRIPGEDPPVGAGPRIGPFRAACAAALFFAAAIAPPASAGFDLTLLLVDPAGGAPTEARLSVTGSDGLSHRPDPDSVCLFHEPLGGYFFADSAAIVGVPEGWTRVRASKGPEFLRFDDRLNVLSDTTLVVPLARWIDARALGWVNGDCHGHLTHPPVNYSVDAAEALLVLKCEGLQVETIVDHGYLFTGGVHSLSDAEATLFCGEEYRSPVFGHLALLGIDKLVVPDWGYLGWPLNAEVVREVRGHAHALASYAHPITTTDFFDVDDWPGTGLAREIWIDAALGVLDAVEVFSYSNLAAPGFAADSLWHNLWNCGFAVPGVVGADACLGNKNCCPLGAFRVYARVSDPYAPPQDLYDAWIESVRRGRTFVSSGPLITSFDAGGAGAGETLRVQSGMPVDVLLHARFEWSRNLCGIQVMRNGEVVETIRPPGGTSYEVCTTVPVRETSWIGVRHDGYVSDDFLPTTRVYAEPTPVLVLLDGDDLTSAGSGSHALERIDLLDSLLGLSVEYPSPEESAAVAAGVAAARAVWVTRSNAPPEAFHLASPCQACSSALLPEFRWSAAVDPDTASTVRYRFVLAWDADFTSVLADTSGLAVPTWTPAEPLEDGARYWWRVRASDDACAARWAEEIDWWFEPSIATGVALAAGENELSIVPAPNPANVAMRDVVFSYRIPPNEEGTLTVFSPEGREIRVFAVPPGNRSIVWDGTDREGKAVASGVYLLRVKAGGGARTGRVCLVR